MGLSNLPATCQGHTAECLHSSEQWWPSNDRWDMCSSVGFTVVTARKWQPSDWLQLVLTTWVTYPPFPASEGLSPDPAIAHLQSNTEQLPFYVGLHFCSSSKKGEKLRTSPILSLPLQYEGGHTLLLWTQGGGWQNCLDLSSKVFLSFPEKRRRPEATLHHTMPLTGRTQANSPPHPTLVGMHKGLRSISNSAQAHHIKPLKWTLCTMLLKLLLTF